MNHLVAVLMRVLIAQIVVDYVVTPRLPKNWWARGSFYVVISVVVIALAVLPLQSWTFYVAVVALSVAAYLMKGAGRHVLAAAARLAHLVILAALTCLFFAPGEKNLVAESLSLVLGHEGVLIVGCAYVLAIWPAGDLVSALTEQWEREREDAGLPNAGLWIGRLERVLVLSFVLVDQIKAIGVLVAAKGILRFGEIRAGEDAKKTRYEIEYVLVGSLMSFTIALLLAWAAKHLLAARG